MDSEKSGTENSIQVPRGIVAALVVALFIGSGSYLFDTWVRNPSADLDELERLVRSLDKRLAVMEYRIRECKSGV